MDEQRIAQIRERLDWRKTEDLIAIWKAHNTKEWTEEAFEAIRQILLTRVDSLPPYENIEEAEKYLDEAKVLWEKAEYENALLECDQAIQIAPSFADAHYEKGLVLEATGRLEDALAPLELAVRLEPESGEIKKGLRKVRNAISLQKTTTDERILAAISHASFIIPTYGAFVPMFVWLLNCSKSKYAAFQSLQALAIQVLAFITQISVFLLIFLSSIGMSVSEITKTDAFSGNVSFLFIGTGFFLFFCIQGILIIYSIFATLSVLMGKDFRYLWIGNLVSQYTAQHNP